MVCSAVHGESPGRFIGGCERERIHAGASHDRGICFRMQIAYANGANTNCPIGCTATKKKPRGRGGVPIRSSWPKSVAAIHHPPPRTPRGRDNAAHIAAAIGVTAAVVSGAADHNARAAPTVPTAVPATMPAAPGGGGGRSQCSRTQRGRGNRNKREFA